MSLVTEPLMWTIALGFFTWLTLAIFTRHTQSTYTQEIFNRYSVIEFSSIVGLLRMGVVLFMFALFGLGAAAFAQINQSSTVVVAPSAGCLVQADADDNLPMQGYNIMAFIYLLTSFGMFLCFYIFYVFSGHTNLLDALIKDKNSDIQVAKQKSFVEGLNDFLSALIYVMLGLLIIFDFIWISGLSLYSPYNTSVYYNILAITGFAATVFIWLLFRWKIRGTHDMMIEIKEIDETTVVTKFFINDFLLLMIILVDTYAKILFFSDVVRIMTYTITCLALPMLSVPKNRFTFLYKFVVCSMVFWSAFYMFYIIYPDNVSMATNGFNPTQNNWLYYLSIWCNASSFSLAQTNVLLTLVSVLSLVTFVACLILYVASWMGNNPTNYFTEDLKNKDD